jgi:hypothetical protein
MILALAAFAITSRLVPAIRFPSAKAAISEAVIAVEEENRALAVEK